jgi:hypothetical protein
MFWHSTNEIHTRVDVRYIGWDADICCMCGDAGGRFRDGYDAVEVSCLEAGSGIGEPVDWSSSDGSHWVSGSELNLLTFSDALSSLSLSCRT